LTLGTSSRSDACITSVWDFAFCAVAGVCSGVKQISVFTNSAHICCCASCASVATSNAILRTRLVECAWWAEAQIGCRVITKRVRAGRADACDVRLLRAVCLVRSANWLRIFIFAGRTCALTCCWIV
jgi:hypothetical protein